MKKIALYLILIIFAGCSRGVWITQNAYRPKHPKFKIQNQVFVGNADIDSAYIYLSTKRFFNYDGRVLRGYMGFYGDGRMIVDNSWENEISNTLSERNSFSTSSSIGYYTTEGDRIKFEYFVPGDGGQYEIESFPLKRSDF